MRRSASKGSVALVTWHPNKGYSVGESAIEFLRSLPDDAEYSVLVMTGKAKSGKSFLLNSLLAENAFPVSNSVDSGTKGIMLATKLIDCEGTKVLLLDCEGFGSLEGNDDRDCKLFVLCLLLSSVVIYNSTGTIDEQTLNNFSMIIEVGKLFEKELQTENSMPSLFWVLRDFGLKMEDKNGTPISSKEYLEGALEEQKGNSQTVCHKNRIRRVIRELFKERTCETLILPTEENPSDLSSGGATLRQEFVSDFEKLRTKLLQMVNRKGPKKFGGVPMTISSFLHALDISVRSLNRSLSEGTMPKIENLSFQLRQLQANECKEKFANFLSEAKQNIVEEIINILKVSEKVDDLNDLKSRFLENVESVYVQTKASVSQLMGEWEHSELTSLKEAFYSQLEAECNALISKWEAENQEEDDLENICEFLGHLNDEEQLDQEYTVEIRRLKERNISKNKDTFANLLMRVEIAYLRRKVELSKEVNLRAEKLNIELEFTKKELQRVQLRNKELESELISTIKQSNKAYETPSKMISSKAVRESAAGKESANKESSSDKFAFSTNKVESSSFYVPYVLIQESSHLSARIAKTLIKEDSKRNNYIEYVIHVDLLGQRWAVNRKFKDFSELHSILVMMFQPEGLPDCRAITGPLSPADANSSKKEIVEQRRKQLENYLSELIGVESIRNSRIVQKFLKINKEYTVL